MSGKPFVAIRVCSFAVACALLLPAQPVNDHCSGAINIGLGVSFGSNIGATTGPDPLPQCSSAMNDVWYRFVPPCTGALAASLCGPGTNFDTVMALWDGSAGCGALVYGTCSQNWCGIASEVDFYAIAGVPYYFSIGGTNGAMGNFSIDIHSIGMYLDFFSAGPGTLGYDTWGGPVGGQSFTAVTLTAGNYPNGWFFGIDISIPDIFNQYDSGFPFVAGPLTSPCGALSVGPFGGLPSGLTVYAVSMGIPAGSTTPTLVSNPHIGVVP
jgi:hypothetical protein